MPDVRGRPVRCPTCTVANLYPADLYAANLYGPDLYGPALYGIKNADSILARLRIVPDTGAFTGYKRLGGFILELLVPADAQRVNAVGSRKCRVSKAELVAATTLDGKPTEVTTFTAHGGYVWTVGQMHEPDSFDPSINVECSHGLHMWITRQEAVDYA